MYVRSLGLCPSPGCPSQWACCSRWLCSGHSVGSGHGPRLSVLCCVLFCFSFSVFKSSPRLSVGFLLFKQFLLIFSLMKGHISSWFLSRKLSTKEGVLGPSLCHQSVKDHVGTERLDTALRTPPTPKSVTLENGPSLFPVFMDEKTLYLRTQPHIFTESLTSVARPEEAVSNLSPEKGEFYSEE